MKKFVIQDSETGEFLYTTKSYLNLGEWVKDLDKARFYGRRCDASNSLTAQRGKANHWSRRTAKFARGLFDDRKPVIREVVLKAELVEKDWTDVK